VCVPTIELNGNPVHYTLNGDGSETVLLVHGELNDSRSWDATAKVLELRFRVLRYDRVSRTGATLEDHARELLGLMDALGIERAHVVGHSGGGVVAVRAIGMKPECALTLTLVDSLGRMDAALETKVKSVLASLEVGGLTLAFTVAAPWLWGARTLEKRGDWLTGLAQRASSTDPALLRDSLKFVLNFGDQRKWLRAVNCPTLVVVGTDDALTPMRYSHEIVEWIKPGYGVLITITGGGHNAPLENPEEFNRILGGFLERYTEFVAGPEAWDDTDDDGAELHDYSDLGQG
jgi:pimeloyl-ACP methyl ester carboxylesterase